eukprot:285413-Prymnesium_polylepis.3
MCALDARRAHHRRLLENLLDLSLLLAHLRRFLLPVEDDLLADRLGLRARGARGAGATERERLS